jgi:hypothetical protein
MLLLLPARTKDKKTAQKRVWGAEEACIVRKQRSCFSFLPGDSPLPISLTPHAIRSKEPRRQGELEERRGRTNGGEGNSGRPLLEEQVVVGEINRDSTSRGKIHYNIPRQPKKLSKIAFSWEKNEK